MKIDNINININELFNSIPKGGYENGEIYDVDSFTKMMDDYRKKRRIEKRSETIKNILNNENKV